MTASPLELTLLGLLDAAPLSGYDLRKLFAETPLGHFSSSPGSIYPALRRLEARKWIAASKPQGTRGRQAYRLRAPGKAALDAWLRGPVGRDDLLAGLHLLVLRFAFMGQRLPREEVVRFLNRLQEELRRYLEELQAYEAENAAAMPRTGRLALRQGIGSFCAAAAWTTEALRDIEGADTWP